jgi:hypothetical protein
MSYVIISRGRCVRRHDGAEEDLLGPIWSVIRGRRERSETLGCKDSLSTHRLCLRGHCGDLSGSSRSTNGRAGCYSWLEVSMEAAVFKTRGEGGCPGVEARRSAGASTKSADQSDAPLKQGPSSDPDVFDAAVAESVADLSTGMVLTRVADDQHRLLRCDLLADDAVRRSCSPD